MKTRIFDYFVNAMIAIVIVLVGMLIVKHNQPPRLVKIDLVRVTTHYTELMAKDTFASKDLTASNPAIKQISDGIKQNLEPVISTYAKDHNVIVVQAQALVATNVPDITDTVISELDKKIK